MYFLINYENRTKLGTFVGFFTFEANKEPLNVDPELLSLAAKDSNRINQVDGKVGSILITSINPVD